MFRISWFNYLQSGYPRQTRRRLMPHPLWKYLFLMAQIDLNIKNGKMIWSLSWNIMILRNTLVLTGKIKRFQRSQTQTLWKSCKEKKWRRQKQLSYEGQKISPTCWSKKNIHHTLLCKNYAKNTQLKMYEKTLILWTTNGTNSRFKTSLWIQI